MKLLRFFIQSYTVTLNYEQGHTVTIFSHNCQNFVNQVCNNLSHSEDVQKWLGRALLGLVLFFSIKAFNN